MTTTTKIINFNKQNTLNNNITQENQGLILYDFIYLFIFFNQIVLLFFGDLLEQLVLDLVLRGETLALVDEPLHVVRVHLAQASISVLLVAKVLVAQQTFAVLNALLGLIRLQLLRFP
jgi:hypothetical protein